MQKISNILKADQYDNNLFINGNFGIWQRVSPNTLGGYTADRWKVQLTSQTGGTQSITNEAGILPGYGFDSNLRLDLSGLTATTNLQQLIEDVKTAQGNNITVAIDCYFTVDAYVFWSALQNYGSSGSASLSLGNQAPVLVKANTLTRVSWTIFIPAVDGKTIAGSNDYLNLWLTIGGSTIPTPTNGTYRFGKAKAEIGSSPTVYRPRLRATELVLCQRYYEKSYDVATALGALTNNGIETATQLNTSFRGNTRFKVAKRITPSVVVYNNGTGVTSSVRGEDNSNLPVSIMYNSTTGLVIGNNNIGGTSGMIYQYHWTADAEL